MNGDNEVDDSRAHFPNVFWAREATEITQISKKLDGVYPGVYELRHNGTAVMPAGTFEQIQNYWKLEFDI